MPYCYNIQNTDNATYFLYFSTKIRMCVRSIFYYTGLVQEIVISWYFIGVCKINRILHARLWIRIHYLLVFNSISGYRVEHSKIKFVSTRGHVISSIIFILLIHGFVLLSMMNASKITQHLCAEPCMHLLIFPRHCSDRKCPPS